MSLKSSMPTFPRRSRTGRHLWIAAGLAAAAVANALVARRTERNHPPAGQFVDVSGVRLHYLDRGQSNPATSTIVLLHGNGATAQDFVASGLVDRLAGEHRVIVFDRPGFGDSDRPRGTIWSAAKQAALLQEALTRLGIERPIVVGHSWGTLVALALALQMGRRMAGLVLLSGYYFPSFRTDVLLFSGPAIPVVGDLLRYTVAPLLGWLMSPIVVRKIFAPVPVSESFEGFPVSMALRPSQIGASAADTAMMIPDAASLCGRYREIEIPVMIVAGDGDKIVKLEQSQRLNETLRQSEIHVVGGAGHMIHHIAPDAVAAAIDVVQSRAAQGPGERPRSMQSAIRLREREHDLWLDAGRPSSGPGAFRTAAVDGITADETAYDKVLEDSFPASDPPANSGIT